MPMLEAGNDQKKTQQGRNPTELFFSVNSDENSLSRVKLFRMAFDQKWGAEATGVDCTAWRYFR